MTRRSAAPAMTGSYRSTQPEYHILYSAAPGPEIAGRHSSLERPEHSGAVHWRVKWQGCRLVSYRSRIAAQQRGSQCQMVFTETAVAGSTSTTMRSSRCRCIEVTTRITAIGQSSNPYRQNQNTKWPEALDVSREGAIAACRGPGGVAVDFRLDVFGRADFQLQSDGVCRLNPELARTVAATATATNWKRSPS